MASRSARTPSGKLLTLEQQVRDLERRPVRGARPTGGTSARRDEYWGIPATLAEQVELANRRPLWFDIDGGYELSYYAPAGAPGLTAPGLVAGAPAGWYPTSRGPWWVSHPSAAVAASPATYVTGWNSVRTSPGGADAFFWNGTVGGVNLAGYYNVDVRMCLQNGSGTANFHFRHLGNNSSVVRANVDGGAAPLITNFATTYRTSYRRCLAMPADSWAVQTNSGSLTVHSHGNIRSEFLIEYVGPPLA